MSTDIWFVAVVRAAEHVRFTAAGPTRAAVAEQLADYVWEQTPRKLAPHEAAKVSALLSSGALGMAVDLYFAALASGPDAESLHGGEIAPVPSCWSCSSHAGKTATAGRHDADPPFL